MPSRAAAASLPLGVKSLRRLADLLMLNSLRTAEDLSPMHRRLPWLLLVLVLALTPRLAGAVVHSTGDGSGNTTPPPDDPGFANVGATAVGGLTGVYLGNRWVLAASHVGEKDYVFNGVVYPAVPGSRIRIMKDGDTADLAMTKLWGPAPPLPALTLSTATPAIDDPVVMIGNGWNREANMTCWNNSWSEVNCPGGTYEGYKKGTGRAVRWGRNLVTANGGNFLFAGLVTRVFEVSFDEAGLPDEAQLVNGDSGGGVFLKRGGQWELVGINEAMGPHPNQPTNTAVFGNTSLMTDLFHYKAEIEAILNTPPQVPLAPWPAFAVGYGALLLVSRRMLSRR